MTSKIFTFLLFSLLIHFIQFSLCEVEFNDNQYSSSAQYIEKRAEPSDNKNEKKIVDINATERVFGVIGIVIFSIFLIFCYFVASCVNRQGMNDVILSIPWTLLNFVLNILFVINEAKAVPSLYMPSIFFLIGPVFVNIALSLAIIVYEKKKGNTEFRRWFYKHSSLAATSTVLAGADMSTLKLLYSRIFRMKRFNAPFSDYSKTMILWGCVISSVIEDLPQLVIQVLYKAKMGQVYRLVPFLTLVTVAIKLPIGIIGRVYEALKDHRKPDKENSPNNNDNNNNNNNDDVEK